jgi:hypothetical protein
MSVDDLSRVVVVVMGSPVYVLGRQERQAEDAQRANACRDAPQHPVRHVAEYIGTRLACLTEEMFRKTSGDRATHHG